MYELDSELESEIEFWKSMISECVLDPDSAEINRMKEALAFAEFKFRSEKTKKNDLGGQFKDCKLIL